MLQRVLQCISPSHGRALIYVWAIEQDELSKRTIPTGADDSVALTVTKGRDVYVPWVLNPLTPETRPPKRRRKQASRDSSPIGLVEGEVAAPAQQSDPPKVFHRYYHMFARGELRELVIGAAAEMGLFIGSSLEAKSTHNGVETAGLEIVADGWERSNYFVELRRWRQ